MNRIEGPDWGVSHKVEVTIRNQARGFAARAGRLDVADDLAQEARIEAWRQVEKGETNRRHILADTREAIRDTARLGTSVDGKIYATWKRKKVYGVISLDQDVGDGENTFGEIFASDGVSVENQALWNVMLSDIVGLLSFEERQVLAAKLEGFSYNEIVRQDEAMSYHKVKKYVRGIRDKVARYLEREDLL